VRRRSSGWRRAGVVHRFSPAAWPAGRCVDSVDPMTDQPTEPRLTEDEALMLEVGWLDLWHATREGQTGSTEAG
jgi:hypothetical protein